MKKFRFRRESNPAIPSTGCYITSFISFLFKDIMIRSGVLISTDSLVSENVRFVVRILYQLSGNVYLTRGYIR